MHSKRLRRRLHAERAPKRRDIVDDDLGENDGNLINVPVGGFTLTGPLTLTIISTLPSTSTPSSTSVISTSSAIQSTATLRSSSTTALTTSSAASQTPPTSTSSSISASTPVPSVVLPAMTSAGVSEQRKESGDLSTTNIPAGGIVGIVIGCLIILGAVLFFLIRSRSRRGRMKLRNTWTRNSPVAISSSIFEPKPFVGDSVPPDMSPEMRFAFPSPPRQFQSSPLAVSIPVSSAMPAPPPSYNNVDAFPSQSALSPRDSRVLSPTSASSPTSAMMSPSSATVVCTFIVTLPDELSIKVGETVRILAEYDDGWALCMHADGEQGMIPLECLSGGRSTTYTSFGAGGLIPPTLDRDARGARRVSSLGPSAPALKVYNP